MAKKPWTPQDIGHGETVFESPNPNVRKKFLELPDSLIDTYADSPKPGETKHEKGGKVGKPIEGMQEDVPRGRAPINREKFFPEGYPRMPGPMGPIAPVTPAPGGVILRGGRPPQAFKHGGPVKKFEFAGGGGSNYGKDYSKR